MQFFFGWLVRCWHSAGLAAGHRALHGFGGAQALQAVSHGDYRRSLCGDHIAEKVQRHGQRIDGLANLNAGCNLNGRLVEALQASRLAQSRMALFI